MFELYIIDLTPFGLLNVAGLDIFSQLGGVFA